MNNREILVNELREKANLIGYWIARERLGYDWGDYSGNDSDLSLKIHAGDKIEFVKPGGWAAITFKDIRPKGLSKAEYGPSQLTNETIEDLNTTKIENLSDNITIERSYKFNESESRTTHEDVGVSVGLELRQQIGYGGEIYGAAGETEITASINSHYNKTWGSESSTGREISNTVKVPPMTEVSLTTRKSKADYKQVGYYDCELDYTIVIWSHGDYEITINSIDDLKNILDGYGPHDHPLSRTFRDMKISDFAYKHIFKPLNLKFEKTIEFSNASAGGIRISERKL